MGRAERGERGLRHQWWTSHNTNSSGLQLLSSLVDPLFILFLFRQLRHNAGVGPAPTGPGLSHCLLLGCQSFTGERKKSDQMEEDCPQIRRQIEGEDETLLISLNNTLSFFFFCLNSTPHSAFYLQIPWMQHIITPPRDKIIMEANEQAGTIGLGVTSSYLPADKGTKHAIRKVQRSVWTRRRRRLKRIHRVSDTFS